MFQYQCCIQFNSNCLSAHSQNHYSPVKLPEVLLLRSWIFYTSTNVDSRLNYFSSCKIFSNCFLSYSLQRSYLLLVLVFISASLYCHGMGIFYFLLLTCSHVVLFLYFCLQKSWKIIPLRSKCCKVWMRDKTFSRFMSSLVLWI